MPRFEQFPGSWRWIGAAPPERIVVAARQILDALRRAAPGSLFRWEDDGTMLVQASGPSGHRVALRPADLTLLRLDADDRPVDQLPLHGRLADEVNAWAGRPVDAPGASRFDAFDRPALGDAARLLNNAHDALHADGVPMLDPGTGRMTVDLSTGESKGLRIDVEGKAAPSWFLAALDQGTGRTARLDVRTDGTAIAQAVEVREFFQPAAGHRA